MPAPTFTLKEGDTSPSLVAILKDGDDVVVNLTGATVTFLMTQKGSTTPKVESPATVTGALTGEVTYDWDAADTDTYGDYMGELEVEFADGSIETFPNSRYIDIKIKRDLGPVVP